MLWQGPNVSVFLDNSFNSVSCRQASTVCCGRDLMFLYSLTTVSTVYLVDRQSTVCCGRDLMFLYSWTTVSTVYLVDRHQLCAVAGT